MRIEKFFKKVEEIGIDTLTGIPDSTLKQFCNYIRNSGAGSFKHYITPNEGTAVGFAAGAYLATGRPACIYMQNSGIGNAVNPFTSLLNKDVYGIPVLLVIGWRGEPGMHDEPQHIFMGKITKKMLQVLEIPYRILDQNTSDATLDSIFTEAKEMLDQKKQFAILVKKNSFINELLPLPDNQYKLIRENVIGEIVKHLQPEDAVISTTGKISRELYEQSNEILGHHKQEFLTVGGMGHASMIAYALAEKINGKKVYCIDGDGAVLMHMGSLAFIGKEAPKNLIHICLNNDAHESVGGMPTGAVGQEYARIALSCGYRKALTIDDESLLAETLSEMGAWEGPVFIEVKVSLISREDLGRPKEKAAVNKNIFMKYHGVIQ